METWDLKVAKRQISVKFAAKNHRFGEKTAFAKKLATLLKNAKFEVFAIELVNIH